MIWDQTEIEGSLQNSILHPCTLLLKIGTFDTLQFIFHIVLI